MSAAAGAAVSAGVLALAWHRRPPPARVRRLRPPGEARPTASPGRLSMLFGTIGRAACRLARRVDLDDATAVRLGRALAVAGLVAVVAAPAAPATALAVWLVPALRHRREARARSAAVAASLPEVVDLFSLAVGAGLTVPLSVAAVARRATGPVGEGLARAARRVELGAGVSDALESMVVSTGDEIRPLVAALVASDRYGVPLASSLDALAGELRADRRRRAEAAARRVPVKLLFPLVVCILPAFALLTVVPLAAGALGSLRL